VEAARCRRWLLALCVFVPAAARPEIIPPDRRIVWTPGVPGGIPDVPVAASVLDFGAKADGATDDRAALQTAIDSTSSGAILAPAGSYLIKSPITIGKAVVLRGEGADRTHLVFDFDGAPAVDAIQIIKYDRGAWVAATGGLTKGSTVITVADSSSFSAGDFAELQQENDPAVMYTSPDWDQGWAADAVGQIFRVVSVGSGTVTVDPPLHLDFDPALNPVIRRQGFVVNAGIERLHLRRIDAGDGDMVELKNAAYCWVRDIESEFAYRCHVCVTSSFRCEIRDSYMRDAHDHGGGGHGYGVDLNRHTTACLVENNVFVHLRHSMMVHVGATGNVFGYNYSTDPYANGGWTPCDISLHGHWPFMNLFEGNTVQEIDVSDYWGPCGPGNTFFRNRVESEGIDVMDHSHDQNVVGNELGTGANVITEKDGATGTLVHGNHVDGALQWDPAIADHDLPASYYLAAKPDFFGTTPWPVTGGDLVPASGLIPAEKRYRGVATRRDADAAVRSLKDGAAGTDDADVKAVVGRYRRTGGR
jgi:hypothetical protein